MKNKLLIGAFLLCIFPLLATVSQTYTLKAPVLATHASRTRIKLDNAQPVGEP
jgi:hypothetical protein